MSAVRFLKGRRPRLPARRGAPQTPGVISAFIASSLKRERPTRPISKPKVLGLEICSTFCSRGQEWSLMPHFGRAVACLLLLSAVIMGGCSNLHRATLANPGLDQQPMRGVFYFPGNWERTRPTGEFYGRYPWLGGNESTYTLHPAKAYHLGFSESAAARTQAVADIAATHANVIVMSYWGPRLTDNWMFWAPMQ